MPRPTFSVGALRAAAPGLSSLAQAIGSGMGSRQDAYERELGIKSKLAMQIAQMDNAEASARAHESTARQNDSETAILTDRPNQFREQVANAAGSDGPTVDAYRQKLRTGAAPQVPMGPPAEDGTMGVGSQQFDPALQSKLAQAIKQFAPMLFNQKDMKPDDLAQADATYNKTGLLNSAVAGAIDRNRLGGAVAASEGKPLYHAAEFGSTDNFTGGVDASGPVAQRFGKFRDSATAENVAQAGSAKASAANSYAHANKANFETQQLKDAPKGKFDPASGMIIDERGATARPVMVDGQPMGGRANDKPLPPAVVKQITEVRDNAATIGRLTKGFDDSYAGKGLLGYGADLQLATSGNLGVDSKAVEWWKNYRKQVELTERHALFGAALTPNEQASWQSADIAPGMNAKTIKTNLATRTALAKKVFENARQDAIDAGHNERRVGAIADRNMEVTGASGKNVSVDY